MKKLLRKIILCILDMKQHYIVTVQDGNIVGVWVLGNAELKRVWKMECGTIIRSEQPISYWEAIESLRTATPSVPPFPMSPPSSN